MTIKWITKADNKALRYYKHKTRKLKDSKRPDRYYSIRFKVAGRDSYKMINTSQEKVSGMNIFEANFEIWKCKP